MVEVPGPPGVAPAPSLFVPEPINNRLWHIAFNRVNHQLTEQRKTRPLTMPVLAIGGADSWGEAVTLAADDVHSVVIAGAGHWVAGLAPDELLTALTTFLAPYRDRG